MTTEEKLQHFNDICMEDATAHFQKIVSEYEAGLQSSFEEHKQDAKRRQAMRLEIETEKIEKEAKRALSADQIKIKREFSKTQETYKEKLFAEVEEKLSAYRKTDAYLALLKKQIADIKTFAGEQACEIYLDPSDEALLPSLPEGVQLSETPFLGGTMAVIPSMNIFIDNSFRSRTEQEKHGFSFAERSAHA